MDPDPALDQLKVSLENYLLAAPEGFPSREAAIDWLGVADAQLQRLLQLQDQCGDGDPVVAEWCAPASGGPKRGMALPAPCDQRLAVDANSLSHTFCAQPPATSAVGTHSHIVRSQAVADKVNSYLQPLREFIAQSAPTPSAAPMQPPHSHHHHQQQQQQKQPQQQQQKQPQQRRRRQEPAIDRSQSPAALIAAAAAVADDRQRRGPADADVVDLAGEDDDRRGPGPMNHGPGQADVVDLAVDLAIDSPQAMQGMQAAGGAGRSSLSPAAAAVQQVVAMGFGQDESVAALLAWYAPSFYKHEHSHQTPLPWVLSSVRFCGAAATTLAQQLNCCAARPAAAVAERLAAQPMGSRATMGHRSDLHGSFRKSWTARPRPSCTGSRPGHSVLVSVETAAGAGLPLLWMVVVVGADLLAVETGRLGLADTIEQ